MAKIQNSALVGAISGAMGSTVFARNKGGQYMRSRSVPITSTTTYALEAKARMAAKTAAFRNLTAAQRMAWEEWAATHTVTDRLGAQIQLTGHQAYVSSNIRADLLPTPGTVATPPVLPAPASLTTLTATWDIGIGDFEIVFTPTPIGATNHLYCQAAVVGSGAINYVTNLLKLVSVTAANQATDLDLQTAIEERFGPLVVGQYVHIWASILSATTGLLSPPLRTSGIVVST